MEKLGLVRDIDLALHLPLRYEDETRLTPMSALRDGDTAQVEAVVREARADMANFTKSRKLMNNLVDTVETVSPFLVDRILAADRSGLRIRWLTPVKMTRRMLAGMVRKRPDQFTPFGL